MAEAKRAKAILSWRGSERINDPNLAGKVVEYEKSPSQEPNMPEQARAVYYRGVKISGTLEIGHEGVMPLPEEPQGTK